ncbi:ATP-dependent DNA helicase DDX11 [Prorops nasuta]|uniref:ATP-dependent DNA helicase DDX11 n=1 Tax=Prorops nasuta TaxID=863751 RepID=UPI0034CFBB83
MVTTAPTQITLRKLTMEAPEKFPFPFPPYPIQDQFMRELYSCLENSKLGIFESPTGTGKSLSIICGALKWLIDNEEYQKQQLTEKITELDKMIEEFNISSSDWFMVQTKQLELRNEKLELQNMLNIIQSFENKKKHYKDLLKEEETKRKKLKYKARATKLETENSNEKINKVTDECKAEQDLIIEDIIPSDDEEEAVEEEIAKNTKIIFCSRTHSQLSQFVSELKRSPYSKNISVVILSSRQNYCINKDVKKLKNINLINERCLQFQKKKATVKKEKDIKRSKSTTCCPFLPGDQEILVADILTEIQDIEEIVDKGKEFKTCAYYGSRKAVKDSQLILVPYNTILHKNTRISSGLDLKGNILIIDEAHNLLEAIERMYSAEITGRNILHCYSQLSQYINRFQMLFSAKNMMFLNQLNFCLRKLSSVFGAKKNSSPDDEVSQKLSPKLYKIEEFEVTTGIDTINLFELLQFIKRSKLMHKLQGFVEKYGDTITIHQKNKQNQSGVKDFLKSIKTKNLGNTVQQIHEENKTKNIEPQISNPIILILSFLESLKTNCTDGRVFVIPAPTIGQGIIKFLLLNPAAHFDDIVKDAKSVILAGGTMQPFSEFTDQLFLAAGATAERILTFSCDHVVPKENILSCIASVGPTGVGFEFNFQNRQNEKLLNELGRALSNICNIVPAGIVVFLPSYNYEEIIYKHLDKTGILKKIQLKKFIFREPKLSSQVNHVLDEYTNRIKKPVAPQNGCLLFSVVGGKLSEGLNFSDDLGRCIIVVGMPYPNIKSFELQEKLKYLNENVAPNTGNIFYENSCMKAVNQCIGRAVRHINDYSTVVLLDKRYSSKTNMLPRWIQRTLHIHTSFGGVISDVGKFFASKKKK